MHTDFIFARNLRGMNYCISFQQFNQITFPTLIWSNIVQHFWVELVELIEYSARDFFSTSKVEIQLKAAVVGSFTGNLNLKLRISNTLHKFNAVKI